MALKPCRECGAQVSDAAEICPHCGVRAPAGAPPAATRAPRKRIGCGGILLAAVVSAIVIALLPKTPLTPEEQEKVKKEEAAKQEREQKQHAEFEADYK